MRLTALGWMVIVVAAGACQRSTPLRARAEAPDGGGGGDDGGAAPALPDGAGLSFEVAAATDAAPASTSCAEEVQTARPALDLLLLIDRSGSMSTNVKGTRLPKWLLVRNGLVGFVKQPDTAGLGMGVQFFPLQPLPCSHDADCVRDGDFCQVPNLCQMGATFGELPCGRGFPLCQLGGSCVPGGICAMSGAPCADFGKPCPGGDATDLCQPLPSTCFDFVDCSPIPYRTPLVPLVELPAGQAQVLAGLALASARGQGTPIFAAASGALDHLRAHQAANRGRRPVLVLATDGDTFGCTDTPDQIAAVLHTAATAPAPIPTYVIGVAEDAASPDLRAFAAAGGTGAPFVVADSGDLDRRFGDVLNQIRGKEAACDFTIPPPQQGPLAFDRVNVDLQPAAAGQPAQPILYVRDIAHCDPGRGGWTYDVDPAAGRPARVILCDASCRGFKADSRNKVEIRFGCQTRID
jgi:hypothetical protein